MAIAKQLVFAKGTINALNKLKKKFSNRTLEIMKKNIIQAEANAKKSMGKGILKAVKDSRAINSISSKTDTKGTFVVAQLSGGTEYFKFIELGTGIYAGNYKTLTPYTVGQPPNTGGMKARPVLNTAIKRQKPKLIKDLQEITK